MPTDRGDDPWAGQTYHGFSGPGAGPAARRAASRPSRTLLLGGIAAATVLGLILGIVAQPDLAMGEKAAPMQAAARAPDDLLAIEVTEPPVLPAPKSSGRLEVLPADMARNAPRATAPPRREAEAAMPEEPELYAADDEEIDGRADYDEGPRRRGESRWDQTRWDDRQRWRDEGPRWRDGPL